jgi:hypothetical protein
MKFLKKPVPLWSHFAVLGVVVLVVGALVAGLAAGLLTPPWLASALGPQSVIRNEQVVTSIERLEQTDLVELSVQGISTAEGLPPALVRDLPILQNARIMQYSMKVQLGVEGVDIQTTADHEFRIAVPAFKWTGMDDFQIDRVFNDDEVLSVFTALPSLTEQQNAIVDDELKQKHLEANQQLLRDQAEFYFTKLARSIDPEATLTFEFAQ